MPPDPSPSSTAWTFTSTSSPSATGPVTPGYATQGRPSTSSRTSPSWRSVTPVTEPRRRLSTAGGLDELERDVEHRLEVGNGDVLGRGVHQHHPVGEVHARNATRVEHVRVGSAADVDRPCFEAS